MPLPRPSLACARRTLARPVVALPLVAVLLSVAALAGYGAWTRSRPVHYARGGSDFAVVPSASPSASAAPAPPSAVRATPAATPSAVPASGAVATAAPHPSSAGQQPAIKGSNGLVLPRTGRYGLRVEGSETVDFGPVSFCSQDLPSTSSLVVSKAQGEGPTSYNFDLPYFEESGKHDERDVYRYTPAGVFLDYEVATVTCQGIRQSSDTTYSPPPLRVRLPLAVGTRWTSTGGDADRTEHSTISVVRTETLSVQGTKVLTYVLETATDFSGSETGSRSQTWWYAPSWAMPVKWSERIDGSRSGAAYREDVTVTVTSRP